MKRFILFLILCSCLIGNSQGLRVDSLTYNDIQFKNSSKDIAFDLGQVQRSEESKTFLLNITNIGDSDIYIERFVTGDDLSGTPPKELIHPGKSCSVKFYFIARPRGNRVQRITIKYQNSTGEESLNFVVRYEIIGSDWEIRTFGIVKDHNGETIPGANVVSKLNHNKGVQTDINGFYSIDVQKNDSLIFTYVGMMDKKVKAQEGEMNVAFEKGIQIEAIIPETYKGNITPMNVISIECNNYSKKFRKDRRAGRIFLFTQSPKLQQIDTEFQQQYKVLYYSCYRLRYQYSPDYMKAYNKLAFEYLTKKFKTDWQSNIRKDTIGLEEFIGRK